MFGLRAAGGASLGAAAIRARHCALAASQDFGSCSALLHTS